MFGFISSVFLPFMIDRHTNSKGGPFPSTICQYHRPICFITPHKQSLEQDNVFYNCLSFWSQEGVGSAQPLLQADPWMQTTCRQTPCRQTPLWADPPVGRPPVVRSPGCRPPCRQTPMHVDPATCRHPPCMQTLPDADTPDTVNELAVPILLEHNLLWV